MIWDIDPNPLGKLWLERMVPPRAHTNDGVQEKQWKVYGGACILQGEASTRAAPDWDFRGEVLIRYKAIQ